MVRERLLLLLNETKVHCCQETEGKLQSPVITFNQSSTLTSTVIVSSHRTQSKFSSCFIYTYLTTGLFVTSKYGLHRQCIVQLAVLSVHLFQTIVLFFLVSLYYYELESASNKAFFIVAKTFALPSENLCPLRSTHICPMTFGR